LGCRQIAGLQRNLDHLISDEDVRLQRSGKGDLSFRESGKPLRQVPPIGVLPAVGAEDQIGQS
jgi:hypothetical protein